MSHSRISLLLATILLLAIAAPISAADGTVVTIDQFARVSPEGGTVTVTGTIACDAEVGEVNLAVQVTQGGLVGTDNLDLSPFPCSETPRGFFAVAETFDCTGGPQDCFRPGKASVEISTIPDDVVVATARIVVRPAQAPAPA
jgi:hypothetical protein